ncbi:hypothetical protein Tco_1113850 [Tanacetum coccineum]|uniref:Uncharacterized protein n=1 Tax=Tanacetum coccineum TaxID=301880 RepID=A0ABQ5IVM8_9ASTR
MKPWCNIAQENVVITVDGINIDDLTIEKYLRLTQENQTLSIVKKVDDKTIAGYIEYEERMKRQYSKNSGSYFPTYSGHCTSSNNITIEFPRNAYFNPIQPNTKFNYDYEDMELDEEDGYKTDGESVMSEHEAIDQAHTVNTRSFKEKLSSEEDLDEWLKAEMEKHMSKQNEKNEEDALIAIIKSIREECRAVHKNKQISVSDLKNSSKAMEDTVNNDSFTSNLPYQPSLEELNLGSFLLPFTIDNYNSYAMANIDDSNNVMPMSIYEYLKLANLLGATMSDDMTQQETLGTVKNISVKLISLSSHVILLCFMMTEVVKIVECSLLVTLTPVSAMVIKRFLEKANRECLDNGFYEYKRMFDNEVEQLSNEYTLRIRKRGFKEEELWQSRDEKTDYEPPFVDVKTVEVNKYSFKGGKSFICITKQDEDALPLGRVNGARFKEMIKKELKDNGIAYDET